MPFPRPASIRVLLQDFREFTRDRSRHQLIAAVAALLIPAGIMVVFYYDAQTNIAPGPRIIYVDSWPASRSDAEIQAKQKVDLEQRRAAEEERRRSFERLDNKLDQLGI